MSTPRGSTRSSVHSRPNGTSTFYMNGTSRDDSHDIDTLLAAPERGVR
jgi:hypothetical protein